MFAKRAIELNPTAELHYTLFRPVVSSEAIGTESGPTRTSSSDQMLRASGRKSREASCGLIDRERPRRVMAPESSILWTEQAWSIDGASLACRPGRVG